MGLAIKFKNLRALAREVYTEGINSGKIQATQEQYVHREFARMTFPFGNTSIRTCNPASERGIYRELKRKFKSGQLKQLAK